MKSDHRHELKTNELAEWLSNLPQWAKENRMTIIYVLVVIAAVTSSYIWKIRSRNVAARKQLELTRLVGQLLDGKMQILRAQEQGRDLSFILLQPAENLRIFAENTNDDQMAAFALIKRAEALRTELHYRMGAVSKQELIDQINQAKASYTEALNLLTIDDFKLPIENRKLKIENRKFKNPSLIAAAKFGLGLCAEELSNFRVAEQIYRDITTNPNFEGTIAAVQAKLRLETMADYKQKIVFPPAPMPKPAAPALDKGEPAQPKLADTNDSSVMLNSTIEGNDIYQPNK